MSFIEVNEWKAAKKQFFYKLTAYKGFFISLFIAQFVALVFSYGGGMHTSISVDLVSLTVSFYSGDMLFGFTLIWAFIVAAKLTSENYRNNDFSFVSTRISSNLSNIALIATLSFVGSVTSLMAGVLLRVIVYFTTDIGMIYGKNYLLSPPELLTGIYAAFLYLALVCAAGYLIGAVVQMHKVLIVLVPAVLFGLVSYELTKFGTIRWVEYFTSEGSLLMFTLKVISAVLIFFAGALVLSNRLEVRR
ncbi:hypothetical protein SAMN05421736_107137 [Evansella caseinilytica]|uniref:ABC-2 type transport system permease protein n=1 Tax=Evansella caseinilytica TaxID=1503961 RepID=A0A1H3R071_9BACI|nr:hypothetical protein [Evansella caseinilytica]SDZ19194.1 hypothetical protein SAMN05421736_107137 [Evansella caseinilytica]